MVVIFDDLIPEKFDDTAPLFFGCNTQAQGQDLGGLRSTVVDAGGGIKKILIPKENEKDLKDVPKTISNQLEIVSVEHMDEVLSHALILDEGDSLFKKVDIPFEMTVENADEPRRLV